MNNILTTIKKLLGLSDDYDYFDLDILTNINMIMPVLTQIGVEIPQDVIITEESKWDDLTLSNDLLNIIKPYIALKVRLIFDPPSNSSLFEAIQKRIDELEWRINLLGESK